MVLCLRLASLKYFRAKNEGDRYVENKPQEAILVINR